MGLGPKPVQWFFFYFNYTSKIFHRSKLFQNTNKQNHSGKMKMMLQYNLDNNIDIIKILTLYHALTFIICKHNLEIVLLYF